MDKVAKGMSTAGKQATRNDILHKSEGGHESGLLHRIACATRNAVDKVRNLFGRHQQPAR